MNLMNEINHVLHTFVAEVTALARRAAVETLDAALVHRGARGRRNGVAIASRKSRGGRPAGIFQPKRTPAELEALAAKFVAFVRTHPGLRIEQINKQIGTTTQELVLPIRKLLGTGEIRTKGAKRSTQYFSGQGGRG